jgi:thiol-disulfide isomerase/thioredoxin
MKTFLTFFTAIIFCSNIFAQYDTTAPYLKTKMLPEFSLLNTDSALFTQTVLAASKPTIIMLYNPDCGHCKEQLELFLAMPEVIENTQLVLASTQPLFKIKQFYQKYKLHQYPNIFAGKDYSWFLGKMYQPKTIPVLAFYNAQNQFLFLSQGSAGKAQILDALKK